MVMIQAITTLPATPQRTAEARLATPAPMIEPVMVCVVDTGMPMAEARKITIDPAVEALFARARTALMGSKGDFIEITPEMLRYRDQEKKIVELFTNVFATHCQRLMEAKFERQVEFAKQAVVIQL